MGAFKNLLIPVEKDHLISLSEFELIVRMVTALAKAYGLKVNTQRYVTPRNELNRSEVEGMPSSGRYVYFNSPELSVNDQYLEDRRHITYYAMRHVEMVYSLPFNRAYALTYYSIDGDGDVSIYDLIVYGA
jgi:hypothetical protein